MGRGRGKGKKLNATSHEDPLSGEEEKIPPQKRRGRPQKPLKDDIEDEELLIKTEEYDSESKSTSGLSKDSSITTTSIDNAKKRKRNSPSKEQPSPVKDENGVGGTTLIVAEVETKPNDFRHIGSRRKNKPRRAAEVGVEC